MISNYKNIHLNETCLIIGNGPSLKTIPNEFLSKYPNFGTNRIYLKYVPKYYVCVNPLVISQNESDIKNLGCEKFIREGMIKSGNQLNCSSRKQFSKEPDIWVYEGYTVTFVCLELAYYMGFRTVLLIGIDHKYDYQGKPNEAMKMGESDPNHFDKNYFVGQWWNNPDLAKSEDAYKMAREVFENDNRKIYNLTEGTALNVFDKGDINQW